MSKFKKEHQRFVDETVEIVTEITDQFSSAIIALKSESKRTKDMVSSVQLSQEMLAELVSKKLRSQDSQIGTILRELREQRAVNQAIFEHLGVELNDVEAVKAHKELKKVSKK